MNKITGHIVVFEHEILKYDSGNKRISKAQFEALERFHGNGVPYYKLIYHGVQFNEHVGVIQIGDTLIEVLPKADKNDTDSTLWRNRLISMLKAVGTFDVKSPSSGKLKIKPNTILDLYFELFIKEVESLLHAGLIKQYRQKEGNLTVLKGSLQFAKNLQHNLVHHERFFVRHTYYDVDHKLHFILYKAIKLLKIINTNNALHSRIGSLLLHFPEMQDIKVYESTFEKLVFSRKNQHYKKAIEIAKLLLLQFHPDVAKGKNHVLALMFDMNLLWERFVYVSLRKNKEVRATITAQTSRYFWKPESNRRTTLRPDIFMEIDGVKIVLDTKWKNLNNFNPSPDDLRQMFVYHDYFEASKTALVYPGKKEDNKFGVFLSPDGIEGGKHCSLIFIETETNVKDWQKKISVSIDDFIRKL